jgi:hypothetical protein
MPSIIYSSIPQLARQLENKLTTEEFKELIYELAKNNVAEFQEYRRDNIPKGYYAAVSKTCPTCGQPL